MSWSEVKKINSDLSVPLDEYLRRGIIKSIQRGTVINGGTVIISPVDTSKSIILLVDSQEYTGGYGQRDGIDFTNFTGAEFTIVKTGRDVCTSRTIWTVVEFY